MKISLPYGCSKFVLDLPLLERVRVVGNQYPVPLDDPLGALEKSLEYPRGCSSLSREIPARGRIAVLISDITRGGNLRAIVSRLLEYLQDNGAGPDRTDLILAMGAHRLHTRDELEMHLGKTVLERWTVIEHDAMDKSALAEMGVTPSGTPCFFNRRVASCELAILVGTISYHYFAGYGGGRKLVLPGVAGIETILANHRLSLRSDPGEGLVSACRPGNLEGNPVHEDMLAGARLLGVPLFALNVVYGSSSPVFINAGDLDVSHREACAFLSRHFEIPLERYYRAVVVSAGGYPRDINLLQSHKAIRHASLALEEGGVMLAAAECREGIGSDSFLEAFANGRRGVPDTIRRKYGLNSQAAISTFDLAERFSIYLKSELEEEIISRFGFCLWKEGFASYVLEGMEDDQILVIGNAASFLPVVRLY